MAWMHGGGGVAVAAIVADKYPPVKQQGRRGKRPSATAWSEPESVAVNPRGAAVLTTMARACIGRMGALGSPGCAAQDGVGHRGPWRRFGGGGLFAVVYGERYLSAN